VGGEEPAGKNNATQRGKEARNSKCNEPHLSGPDTRQEGCFLIPPDGIEASAVGGLLQKQGHHQHRQCHDEDRDGKESHTSLSQDTEILRKGEDGGALGDEQRHTTIRCHGCKGADKGGEPSIGDEQAIKQPSTRAERHGNENAGKGSHPRFHQQSRHYPDQGCDGTDGEV